MTALHARARAAGLHHAWQDASGKRQTVSDYALSAILDALGSDDATAGSPFVSGDVGHPIPFFVSGRATLRLEDGTERALLLEGGMIPAIGVAGYHTLAIDGSTTTIAVAPERCFSIEDAAPGRRIWGPAVQIPSLRDDCAYGGFATLARTARAFAERGADAIAISPTHALFPADATQVSPYSPSSRDFLNVLLADPGMPSDLPVSALIDWPSAVAERLAQLRRSFDALSDVERAALNAYRREGGTPLEDHATFEALHAHFFAQGGAKAWQDWPAAFHDPRGAAVSRFVRERRSAVDFHLFLQWRAETGLAAAQSAARDAGMAIGLIADLAVGLDSGGSHAWSRRGELLSGLSIGAPPDPLGPDGQNWGITGYDPRALRRLRFAPFVAMIRAALAHAGGIRIDHAFGLRRLWVVPEGGAAADGAYLTMPFDDLMRIVAIESHRAWAIVVGEDLGTVPDGFRAAMDARGMLGMRVLWFERYGAGFLPVPRWSRDAAAMTGTHDLPTVAGWWQGRDIDWTWALGRSSSAIDEAGERAARSEDRTALWDAIGAGAEPAIDDPAPVVDAALSHIASTPSAIAILPLEDLVGLVEQPNLPGTIDEHPNWRRRMPDTIDALLARGPIDARIAAIDLARRS